MTAEGRGDSPATAYDVVTAPGSEGFTAEEVQAFYAGRVQPECRNAGYSYDGGKYGTRHRYVARCGCGWRTSPRTTYERAQAALSQHLSAPARVQS